MRNGLLLLLLLASISLFAQPTAYQSFEVDNVAEPRGGIPFLTTFLQANLRKPIEAEAKGIGGRVIVGGVVEADGRIANVKIMQSLRPDCDREAMRVFSLFNAWKPAKKEGKAVRQLVAIPILFKPNASFKYEHGIQTLYLDADINLLSDSSERVKFKQINPLDTNGLPNGDLVVFKLAGTVWQEYLRDSLVHTPNGQTDLSGQPIYSIGHQQALQKLKGYLYTVSADGKLLTENYYKEGKLFGPQLVYHANGALAEKKEYMTDHQLITAWYTNGQIRKVQETKVGFGFEPAVLEKVTAVWDSTGQQLVKDGNGWATYVQPIKSRHAQGQQTFLIEQGPYKNYFKEGTWTGRYADSSYFYEEQYDKGVLVAGRSNLAGQDTLAYRVEDRLPAFPGGIQKLGTFLTNNLHYPIEAQRDGAQGTVFVSFTVCTDGTLCDYKILKSVHPALDKEALRVVKKTSGQWQSGFQEGKKVNVKYNLPVNFFFR